MLSPSAASDDKCSSPSMQDLLDTSCREFYCRSLELASQSGVPFLVGGAFALEQYTGIVRYTKDLDFFVRRGDCDQLLQTYTEAGYRAELTFPHWLAKAYDGDRFIDLIYSSGNGLVEVDAEWFEYAIPASLLGHPVLLCPVEEMIWSKAFIMERERFDGADIAHILRASAETISWDRLLRRFDRHWRVLLSHLTLFGYIYPGERHRIPEPVMATLLDGLRDELTTSAQKRNAARECSCRESNTCPIYSSGDTRTCDSNPK